MISLFYLIRKSIKNSLKELLHKPGKLILYSFVLLFIIGMIVLSFFTSARIDEVAPMYIFCGILFAFEVMFMVITVVKSLSGGDTIFGMNDVNLLFVSPVSPRKILLYGVIRLTRDSFYAGFFILFQSSSLANFGINFGGILLTLACYILAMVVLSILSLIIYNLTNGQPRRKMAVKLITFLLFVPLVVYFGVAFLRSGEVLTALTQAIQSPFLSFIPVAGWTAAGVTGLLSGELLSGFFFLSLNLLFGAGLLAYLLLGKIDYYEDTLVSTVTAFEKKRALAEGDLHATQSTRRNVKVTGTGIRGIGAATLFGKHLRESFRQNRLGFLSLTSLIISAGAIIFCYLTKSPVTVLQIMMWLQIIMIGTGRGLYETYTHYIYLIPESSFRKILWSNMELVIKVLIESLLIFIIGGILAGASVFIILGSIAVYTMFSLMLIGINYLFMRFLGANLSNGLLLMIYYLAVVIAIAPGLAAALIVGFSMGKTAGTVIGLGILAGWELAVGLAALFLSRGVLDNCDMPTVKAKS